jgi:uncharacterized protein (TIGR02246 family)
MSASKLSQDRDSDRAARDLYAEILRRWNERSPKAFAELFTARGNMVGFDGSQVNGREEIEIHLAQVFGHHPTAAYVGRVREVRPLAREAVLLRAVAGMVPPGQSDVNPALNTIHTLVAGRGRDAWRIELFQSTPAAFHGRPEASEALTAELRQELEKRPEGEPLKR